MEISFENKVALVTGAGSGMGLVTAKAFAESGAAVVLGDHHFESVDIASKQLVAQGHKALAIRCDVADEREVAAMVERTVSGFGRLDASTIPQYSCPIAVVHRHSQRLGCGHV